jgi:hypothetical protein
VSTYPIRYDARTPRGDSFVSKTFAIVIDELGVDLTDWEVTAQIRINNQVIHTFQGDEIITGTGVVPYKTTTLNTGWLRLEAPSFVTENWPLGVGDWDWQIANFSQTYTIVKGSFRIAKDVTR